MYTISTYLQNVSKFNQSGSKGENSTDPVMFTVTKEPIYSFVLDEITYDVIEDDPDNKDLKVRTVHGEFEFAKEELQRLLDTGEADFK